MLTPAHNSLLTRVGPGTPMGRTLRRYWQPALLAEEVVERDGPPVRVHLLGEDLLAFRATNGKVGLVDAFCPHRRAPLFFGRNEENGLRCVYHGWKFDCTGACVDMPSEPPDSLFKTKVALTAYPTHESGGVVWAYLGPTEHIPAPPDYEWTRVPAGRRFISKTFTACNWLQALEGGVDTAHTQFLHNERLGDRSVMRNRSRGPLVINVELKPYGFTFNAVRDMGGEGNYVRVYQYLMPAQPMRGNLLLVTGRPNPMPKIDGHIWVPIDDEHTWTYNWMYAYDAQTNWTDDGVRAFETREGRGPDHVLPDFRLKANKTNDYFIDRKRQKTTSSTGIIGINTQDLAVQEGMGSICDRTVEHLGTSDRAVIAMRQLLFEAIERVERDEDPPGCDPQTYRDVRPHDALVPPGVDWHNALERELVAKW